ncbi:transmembrane protein 222-like [Sinocyclocheilus anshuiensis]|uniref:transmembrane protein 222-like n=1 Tax=Sinocyclocheilus anshuiensis TaxID=1608454 RepID=UPI0007B9071D|nr:PREDICTED: transmembrane protein 222-like [Sinocyclocheilus anshuiensis]
MADAVEIETMKNYNIAFERIDPSISRYPYCIVWTPIPVLSWLFPFIGHMGICTSSGVIRDFAGPYFVSFSLTAYVLAAVLICFIPRYWMLDVSKVYASGSNTWDTAVHNASEEYKQRMHNLCCDNCHSHVAMALNLMRYDNSTSWNMVKLCLLSLIHGKHVSCVGFLKTWLPFCILTSVILAVTLSLNLR